MTEERTTSDASRLSQPAVGLIYTAAAFLLWGLLPIFWKAVGHVPAPELLAHRIFWSAVIMALLLYRQRRWGSLRQLLKRRRTVLTLLATTALIGGNWFIYIWAMLSEQILEASLGYFINPLVSVLLGLMVLGERLRPWQVVSIGLATVGVVILTVHVGALPWLGLWLAFSFGLYGLLRKTIAASPEEGLAVETWLLSPFMLGYLLHLAATGQGAFGRIGPGTTVLLILTGVVTATPLIWFTHGARRLPLATVGILQYLAPTGQFLLAVGVYGEPFEALHLLAFTFIWTALIIFSVELRVHWRRSRAWHAGGEP